MRKVIFGSLLMLAGSLSAAMLLAGSMANDWTLDGAHSALWNLSRYGLMPALYLMIALAVVGAAVAVIGILERKD